MDAGMCIRFRTSSLDKTSSSAAYDGVSGSAINRLPS